MLMLEGEEMTNEQLLILAACIWLAPHAPNWLGLINGCVILIVAFAIKLGLI